VNDSASGHPGFAPADYPADLERTCLAAGLARPVMIDLSSLPS
jgi:hypothetical protein